MSRLVLDDTLKFLYAKREEGSSSEELVWVKEWEEAVLPLGIKVSLSFMNVSDKEHPIKVEKNIFIPRSSWLTGTLE